MVKNLNVILGDQLFANHQALNSEDEFYMAETKDLATVYKYNKKKIVLFFTAMRKHKDKLIRENKKVTYKKIDETTNYVTQLKKHVTKNDIKKITTYNVADKSFRKIISKFCEENNIELEFKQNPMFLNTTKEFQEYKERKGLFMKTFYEEQRRKTGILMDNGPIGGKYSYDSENRKKLPKNYEAKPLPKIEEDEILQQVKKDVDKHFKNHLGTTKNFNYPTTRKQSLAWLDTFFQERFQDFGPYQDAIEPDKVYLNHSIISPMMNMGLLTPKEVIHKALEQYEKDNAKLNSVEGFIRQIMGWREFMKGVYETTNLRLNHFNHKRKMKQSWYDATTGLKPLDDSIKKARDHGYVHHIERLMILSNIMLLSNIHPDEVHKWFMEHFVDSTEWVMYANVYGMGLYSDGGKFSTKPYVASSNYIRKMSHYKKGEWTDIMDGLYWKFIEENQEEFKKNPRMSMMANMINRLSDEKKQRIFKARKKWLEKNTYT